MLSHRERRRGISTREWYELYFDYGICLHYSIPIYSWIYKCPMLVTSYSLSPFAQDTHHHHSTHKTQTSQRHRERVRIRQFSLVSMCTNHPVRSPHLHDTNPDQNTCRQRIQRANSNNRRLIVSVELVQNANTNGHSKRRYECKQRSKSHLFLHGEALGGNWYNTGAGSSVGVVAVDSLVNVTFVCGVVDEGVVFSADGGDSGAECEAFEDLVEEDDYE